MAQTLEQQRAADAWQQAGGARANHCINEYANLAKGVPALIMNSGLLQVLAFLHEKSSKPGDHHALLGKHLRQWLCQRFKKLEPTQARFEPFMEALMDADPALFQDITAEAMAWLRWARQIAPARSPEEA